MTCTLFAEGGARGAAWQASFSCSASILEYVVIQTQEALTIRLGAVLASASFVRESDSDLAALPVQVRKIAQCDFFIRVCA